MAKKGYGTRFVEWQNYVHYVVLALLIAFWFVVFSTTDKGFTLRFLGELLAVVFVADSLVHALFWYAPKPYRWRD